MLGVTTNTGFVSALWGRPVLVYIDFETRSAADLKAVGVWNYAGHSSTQAACMAFAIDDYPVEIWTAASGEDFPRKLFTHALLVAHNVPFERAILRECFGIDIPLDRWLDTQALARHGGLPARLVDLAKALKLDEQKDMAGNLTMLKLAKPRKGVAPGEGEDDGPRFWSEDALPEQFAQMYAYCKQDVRVMRAALPRLPPMSATERALWLSTEAANERGVRIDLASIPAARAFAEGHAARLEARYTALTGEKMLATVEAKANAMGLTDFRKPTVRNALRRADLLPSIREALEIRQAGARSSVAKLRALQNRTSPDGYLRGALTYCGAIRTGRFSSSGVQLQNFPRGYGAQTEMAFRALDAGVLDIVFPDEIGTIAEMLRGFIVGPFVVADFAQIEARVLAWLAGEEWLLSTFRLKGDPYKLMASRIYGLPTEEITKDQRFMGKQVILGCGYQMGPPKFKTMLDETYDMVITEAFAEEVVGTYRQVHPKIVALWSTLQQGMIAAVTERKTFRAGPVATGIEGTSAFIHLPSGRKIFYPRARMGPRGIEYWGNSREVGSGGWGMISGYGGKFVENITQAVARDVMAIAMLRLEAEGIKTVFTVHDEIVVDAGIDVSRFRDILLKVPKWAEGLPIEADIFTTERYRK
jgi:DNA polymerase